MSSVNQPPSNPRSSVSMPLEGPEIYAMRTELNRYCISFANRLRGEGDEASLRTLSHERRDAAAAAIRETVQKRPQSERMAVMRGIEQALRTDWENDYMKTQMLRTKLSDASPTTNKAFAQAFQDVLSAVTVSAMNEADAIPVQLEADAKTRQGLASVFEGEGAGI